MLLTNKDTIQSLTNKKKTHTKKKHKKKHGAPWVFHGHQGFPSDTIDFP